MKKRKELKVLNFINSTYNWEDVLSSSPYNIIIKHKYPFILLKYNQFESDFNEPMVKECRGLILKQDNIQLASLPPIQQYKVASMRFTKFFNYGQEQAAKLEFPCIASEKIDGSLVGVWFDLETGWHISTSGNIDAKDASMLGVAGFNCFRDLFDSIWDNNYFNKMNKNLTYMFELVSPYNKLVVNYPETKLYLLAIRDNNSLEEWNIEDVVKHGQEIFNENILYPKYFICNDIEEIKEKANSLKEDNENWEGFVLCDKYFNRIKLKSPLYAELFFLRGEGVFSDKKILQLILDEQDDDILSYFPEYKNDFNRIRKGLVLFVTGIKNDLKIYEQFSSLTKKEFAEKANKSKNKGILFLAYTYNYWEKDDEWKATFIKEYIEKMYLHKILERIYEELKDE